MADYKVPYTFIAGTRARASQVNADFEYLTDSLKELDNSKAELRGDATLTFSVADPLSSNHAATKHYVDEAIENAGGTGSGGSGVGKSLFEVFHTLSTLTPPGAFSLRTGELLYDVETSYPTFWDALREQSEGIIPDLTDVSSLPSGYTSSYTNVVSDLNKDRIFSPFSWITSNSVPSSADPIVAELQLPSFVSCEYFRVNSHVFDTYNSSGAADPQKAIKTASILVKKSDESWVPVAIIDDVTAPTSNERYFVSTEPNLAFNAIRLVVSANFGATLTDISVYPLNVQHTSVRVISEEQWQWEANRYGESGGFVVDKDAKTVRLPKINGILSGVHDLWQVGTMDFMTSGAATQWEDDSGTSSSASLAQVPVTKTGLWIQGFNAVAEDALANMRYIPNATLFEERNFRFIPDESTGWSVADGNWKDGTFYVDAYTELSAYAAKAVATTGDYSLAPNGMRFVTDSIYTSTYREYGEAPYYVVDLENRRFKVPVSDNYVRSTHTIDNTGEFIHSKKPAEYSDETEVDSSYALLCVFLGNEVPQSIAVDVFKKIDANNTSIEELNQKQTDVETSLSQTDAALSEQSTKLESTQTSLENVQASLEATDSAVAFMQTDITLLQDKTTLQDTQIGSLNTSTNILFQQVSDKQDVFEVQDGMEMVTVTPEDPAEEDYKVLRFTDAFKTEVAGKATTSYVDTQLALKADLTYVNDELAKKQDVLTAGTGIEISSDNVISVIENGVSGDLPADAASLSADQTFTGANSFTQPLDLNGMSLQGEMVVEDVADATNVYAKLTVGFERDTGSVVAPSGLTVSKEPEFIIQVDDMSNGVLEGSRSYNVPLFFNAGSGINVVQDKSTITVSLDSTVDVSSKADLTYVDDELAKKQDAISFGSGLSFDSNTNTLSAEVPSVDVSSKADLTYVDNQLALKANASDVTEALGHKQDKITFGSGLSYEESTKTLSASITAAAVNAYTKTEVDGFLADKADESTVTALTTRVSTVESQLGGITLQKITQAEYDALATKDENTLYVVVG